MANPGTGGTPPPPAGYTDPPLPGVAAGTVNIFRGRLVIVFGPAGVVSGVFVYAQGTTPGPGNPPVFWATSSATDPYGNAIPSTAGVAGSGSFEAGFTIINANGKFTYSGIPALNNLIASDCPANTTDPVGNSALQGVTSYGGSTGKWQAISLAQGGLLNWYTNGNVNMTGAWTQAGQIAPTAGSSVLMNNGGLGFTISDASNFQMDGGVVQLFKLTGSPSGVLGTMSQVYADATTGGLTRVTPAGLTDRISGAQGDHTRFTVAGTGSNQLTKAWDIPINDAQADTHYRLTSWGKGTWGSTLQQLTTNVSGGHAGANVPAGSQVISANFFWKAILDLHIETGGALGTATWNLIIEGSTGAGVQFKAAGNSEAGAFNTTIDNTVALFTGWASVTGAPTITSDGSIFERLGR